MIPYTISGQHYFKIVFIFIFLSFSIFNFNYASGNSYPLSEIENNIIRGAILAEMEIIEAYSASLELTILDKKNRAIAIYNLKNHKKNIAILRKFILKSQNSTKFELDYEFPKEDLNTQKQLTRFLSDMESSLNIAYKDALENITNGNLKSKMNIIINTNKSF